MKTSRAELDPDNGQRDHREPAGGKDRSAGAHDGAGMNSGRLKISLVERDRTSIIA
jgi:hypothetical protein